MAYSIINFLLVIFEFNNAIHISKYYLLILILKSSIIFGSWIFSFIAIKNLPISIVAPFNTLGPIFSILLGIFILNERLGYFQIAGLILIFISYFLISKTAEIEIGNIFKNKYLYFMCLAMLLGSISGMIDKISLKDITVQQMQFWFSFFTALFYTISYLVLRKKEKQASKFSWYIPLMSIVFVLSDRIYYYAMKMPSSQLSMVSPLRRVSVIVSVIIGGLIFKEKNIKKKGFAVGILMLGLIIIFLKR